MLLTGKLYPSKRLIFASISWMSLALAPGPDSWTPEVQTPGSRASGLQDPDSWTLGGPDSCTPRTPGPGIQTPEPWLLDSRESLDPWTGDARVHMYAHLCRRLMRRLSERLRVPTLMTMMTSTMTSQLHVTSPAYVLWRQIHARRRMARRRWE